jgi:hypothetical protein
MGHAIAQAANRRLPTAAAHVQSQARSLGTCGGKMALGQVSSEYFGFPCQLSFQGWYNRPISGRRMKWIQPHHTLRN